MNYEELSYRRMLQVIRSSRTARLAVVQNGAPYVVPVCVSSRMDGCIPVFEVRAGSDGDLLAALASNAAVMLEFESPGHAGAVETVLVRGRAVVEQRIAPCGCGGSCSLREHAAAESRREPDLWAQSGRVRFDARDVWTSGYAADRYAAGRGGEGERRCESCSCRREETDCRRTGCAACSRRESCGCAARQSAAGAAAAPAAAFAAVITITAAEMTGRCYAACVARCRTMDWEG